MVSETKVLGGRKGATRGKIRNRRTRGLRTHPTNRVATALRRSPVPPPAAPSICVNLRNLRIHYLRLGQRVSTDLSIQNKANLGHGGLAVINVLTRGYERYVRPVRLRKQSQFAGLRLLRRFAPRNDITALVPFGGRRTCLRERRHGTRTVCSVPVRASFRMGGGGGSRTESPPCSPPQARPLQRERLTASLRAQNKANFQRAE